MTISRIFLGVNSGSVGAVGFTQVVISREADLFTLGSETAVPVSEYPVPQINSYRLTSGEKGVVTPSSAMGLDKTKPSSDMSVPMAASCNMVVQENVQTKINQHVRIPLMERSTL